MIINLTITSPQTGGSKRYRFDTAKAVRNKEAARLSNEKCDQLLRESIFALYPIPMTAYSRGDTLSLLAEMERRGLAQTHMNYMLGVGQPGRSPPITYGDSAFNSSS